MEEITFDSEQSATPSVLYGRFERSVRVPTLVQWTLTAGIAKNEHTARYFLLTIAIGAALLAVAILLFFSGGKNVSTGEPFPAGWSTFTSGHTQ